MTTGNVSILYFVTVLIRRTIIKKRAHQGFNSECSSPESPVCTNAVHCHKMTREMVVYKSVWTQRHKKDQRSEISTTGLRSRISESPRAFAGSALSECHFLVEYFFPPLIHERQNMPKFLPNDTSTFSNSFFSTNTSLISFITNSSDSSLFEEAYLIANDRSRFFVRILIV